MHRLMIALAFCAACRRDEPAPLVVDAAAPVVALDPVALQTALGPPVLAADEHARTAPAARQGELQALEDAAKRAIARLELTPDADTMRTAQAAVDRYVQATSK